MAESTSHPQSSYNYVPSSAASTRQVLESRPSNPPKAWSSTLPSATTSSGEEVFRPQVFQRRSSNYADADAAARIVHAMQLHDTSTAPATDSAPSKYKGDEATETSPNTAASSAGIGTGWKPQLGRAQSWNRQDLRRLMQMKTVPSDTGPGYSSGSES